MGEENDTKKQKKITLSIMRSTAKAFIIIALLLSLSSVFFTFSLREVYMNDTSDKSFKDHKEEYEELKGEGEGYKNLHPMRNLKN